MVEGARLESVYTGNRIEGSNPFLSAKSPTSACGAFLRSINTLFKPDFLRLIAVWIGMTISDITFTSYKA